MIDTRLVLKYCGVRIDAHALTDAFPAGTDQPTVASELRDVLTALASTETHITRLVPTLRDALRDVEQVLAAGPDDRIPVIDSTGALQARGPRLDALIGRRTAQIEHLRAMTRLWVAQHPTAQSR
ncbi:hypothetical protein O3597_25820 [Verrucosispora sp. WMMA2044]|uniref:hypothetical protein n=1 Tax=Verrucosispora sp. WMMA2044 TaxID=3016419 RepID=UPI00248A9639|nr:hypothetical protein [Verrucosispora sp. WMMA2044]WBB48460.1 hypothetical protein O3597_25820 [Verrucosispora sp. WMMA2044]